MKSLLSIVFVTSLAVGAYAADTASISGNWTIHNSIAGHESDQTCTFTEKESDLTGSCKTDSGTVSITGKIEGQKVTWTYKTEYNGSPLTLTYNGTLDAPDKFNGSVKVEEFSVEGEFTATRSK